MTKLALIVATFYPKIAESLEQGAEQAIAATSDYSSKSYHVPGCLEIPQLIRQLAQLADPPSGYLALGCVIRGETSHYQVVVEQTNQGLMHLSIDYGCLIGNGIITAENMAQAQARAEPPPLADGTKFTNKGLQAATALLSLLTHCNSINAKQ